MSFKPNGVALLADTWALRWQDLRERQKRVRRLQTEWMKLEFVGVVERIKLRPVGSSSSGGGGRMFQMWMTTAN